MKRPEGNFDRLPAWAKRYIEQLERRSKEDRARWEALSAGDTDTYVSTYGVYLDQALPNGSHVRFVVGPDRERDYIECSNRDGLVHVMAAGGSRVGDAPVVFPQSGNVLRIALLPLPERRRA